jgi:hypothetical protein
LVCAVAPKQSSDVAVATADKIKVFIVEVLG